MNNDFILKSSPFAFSLVLPFFLVLLSTLSLAQETTTHTFGTVLNTAALPLEVATIQITNESTQNKYATYTNSHGRFVLPNLRPGNNYSIIITHISYEPLYLTNLILPLAPYSALLDSDGNELSEFILQPQSTQLQQVNVSAPGKQLLSPSLQISNATLAALPSISRNLQDYVRLLPNARVNGEGMMSIAGQSNKFNALYIDGINNNDILGISLNGSIGGQTNTPPVSVEAIDQMNVMDAPYDVQYGNFTGGTINVITKSGSNSFKSSSWYFFRNEQMAGRVPIPQPKPGYPEILERPRLTPFFNQIAGTSLSGPLIKNKLFYYVLFELQSESNPRPYNMAGYKGVNTAKQLQELRNSLISKYNYDPGSFLNPKESLKAGSTLLKLDWNLSSQDKLSFSYRFNAPEKIALRPGSNLLIPFENNGFEVVSRTHAAALEWRHYWKNHLSGKLLVAYTSQMDDRKLLGKPFPQIIIGDGFARIYLGSNGSSQFSLMNANSWTIQESLHLTRNNHQFSAGASVNITSINDLAVATYFGNYQYRNLADFLQDQYPVRYARTFFPDASPIVESRAPAARYQSQHAAMYLQDYISINSDFHVTLGLRLDRNALPGNYPDDRFFNDTARPVIQQYYSLEGARSGSNMQSDYQLNPRAGFTYRLRNHDMKIYGGAGLFTGHILNIWASSLFNANLGSIDIRPEDFQMHFIADPYGQPTYQSLGTTSSARGTRVLLARRFKYPSVFRTSMGIEKKWKKNWLTTLEFLYTRNRHETKITNVNLLPPTQKTSAPGSRSVYAANGSPPQIPLLSNGINPYTGVYLLSNYHGTPGYAFNVTATVTKQFSRNFTWMTAYNYGISLAVFEPTGNAGPIEEQWNQSETVNGRNTIGRTKSDMDPGHRIYSYLSKTIPLHKGKAATRLTIFYNGQSGQRFSYVDSGSVINDSRQPNFDLSYIPTAKDLESMIFLDYTDNNKTYSAQDQKAAFNEFILHDRYLSKHRGEFAERNGARLPFTHTIDIRMQQDLHCRVGKHRTLISIIFDVFNFTNLLNKNLGRIYTVGSDNFPLIRFMGYTNNNNLQPQYQFRQVKGTVYGLQSSTAPGSSARWISQLGIRVSFE